MADETEALGSIPPAFEDDDDSADVLALVSIALSGLGFLTLLRLADRRERAPASALGLFFVTSLATITGTTFGLVAARQAAIRSGTAKGCFSEPREQCSA